jgi:hypothetical protein
MNSSSDFYDVSGAIVVPSWGKPNIRATSRHLKK